MSSLDLILGTEWRRRPLRDDEEWCSGCRQLDDDCLCGTVDDYMPDEYFENLREPDDE